MKRRINELRKIIHRYNFEYYNNNNSLITDDEFDDILHELKLLEKKHPEFDDDKSPTNLVGGFVDSRFEKITHDSKMYSLDNAFSSDDLIKFDKKINENSNGKYSYVCELKMDGLAIDLKYNPHFYQAVTRGDGLIGEDVSHNALNIQNLPKVCKHNINVRGEIYMNKKEFVRINDNSEVKYANSRNLVAGTIRQLDSKKSAKRNINMTCYALNNYKDFEHKTYHESMMFLKKSGFEINSKIKVCKNIDEVIEYIKKLEPLRDELGFDIDGIVIKVNEYSLCEKIGYTSKFPKFSIAYKFKSTEVSTKLTDIIYTIGRSGKLTPTAVLDPVNIMGSTVSRATLHNFNYIQNLKLHFNDIVSITKAGDIIPRILKVVKSDTDNKLVDRLENCPICKSKLEIVETEQYCRNEFCKSRLEQKLIYFTSKSGLNIDGLGEKNVLRLINEGLVTNYSDFYKLSFEQLMNLDGFKEKSSLKLIESIEKSKKTDLSKFITALAIDNVGSVISKDLCKEITSIDGFLNLKLDDIKLINGIGDVVASKLFEYFSNQQYIDEITKLINLGFEFNVLKEVINTENDFFEKSFAITGTFSEYKRSDIKVLFEKLGGKNTSSISSKTDFLIAGTKAGSKLDKALSLNINIIDEEKLNLLFKEYNEI